MKEKETEYKFSGKVIRCIWNSDDFKVYVLDVDMKKYPNLKKSKYGKVVINGELPDLIEDVEYEVVGVEKTTKNGIGYKVTNIKRDLPTTAEEMYLFLSEILTPNQSKVLWEHYPDIVQRVKENRLDDIDLNKLKGIKEYTFECIKQKIIENFCLADLIVEFQGYLNLPIIRKIYNKYSSVEVLKKKLKQNPYKCLCSLAGVGFKTADKLLLDIEKVSKQNVENGKEPIIEFESDLKSSPERCLAFLLYLLNENENEGHTKMNLADLRRECIKLVPACSNHFTDVIKSKDIYYNKETMDVASKKTYDIEYFIANRILSVLNAKSQCNIWDYDAEKYRIINGLSLSDEQIEAIKNVCKYNISILNGSGGTGKSFSTRAIVRMLKEHDKTFALLSPTGKAAKVLSDYTKEIAATIHRGLGYVPAGFHYFNGNPVTHKDRYDYFTHFKLNKYNKISADVVIVDEFSMVDIALFKSLLEAIDFSTTKLLLIGDDAQLCSVGCGNLLHDFMESKVIPTVTLTKVFRYGEGGLMRAATDVRFCKKYLDSSMKSKAAVFGENKDYTFVDLASEAIPQNVVALYKKLLEMGKVPENIQVLTAKNVGDCGTATLNNMIQEVANPNYGSERRMKIGETTYFEGDLVIQKTNNYKAELDIGHLCNDFENETENFTGKIPTAFIANGETGIIDSIENSYMIINFDGVYVKYYRNDLSMIGLGYSITIHKSQGSSIDNVILCTPQSHSFMLNSNLLYVGLTRTKKKCFHLGTLSSVNKAISKKANLTRQTFMRQLLNNSAAK